MFAEKNLDLEFKTWTEIRPFYNQIRRMLGIIFVFVFILLAMLVVFTIYNTQSAGIVERMGELGTLRAMGLDQRGLWRIRGNIKVDIGAVEVQFRYRNPIVLP